MAYEILSTSKINKRILKIHVDPLFLPPWIIFEYLVGTFGLFGLVGIFGLVGQF